MTFTQQPAPDRTPSPGKTGRPGSPIGHQALVLYDGNCGLCHALALWSAKRADGMRLLPSQSVDLARISPQLTRSLTEKTLVYVGTGGELHLGARAVFQVLTHLPRWRLLGRLLARPFWGAAAEPFYRHIAERRVWISQVLGLDACALEDQTPG